MCWGKKEGLRCWLSSSVISYCTPLPTAESSETFRQDYHQAMITNNGEPHFPSSATPHLAAQGTKREKQVLKRSLPAHGGLWLFTSIAKRLKQTTSCPFFDKEKMGSQKAEILQNSAAHRSRAKLPRPALGVINIRELQGIWLKALASPHTYYKQTSSQKQTSSCWIPANIQIYVKKKRLQRKQCKSQTIRVPW